MADVFTSALSIIGKAVKSMIHAVVDTVAFFTIGAFLISSLF